ncbi:MAG: alpha-amylase family glycosyl hydrolase [Myxococcota bacterium]
MTTESNHAPWWQTAVIYQIYPRSFLDHDGDGVGDLRGIREKLPYLSETLGIDAIWLSPFYPSPMADFGYDVSNYCDVDPVFGTLDDFDALVTAAHAAGLKMVVDFVPNHTSDAHPWFVEARARRDSLKRDWYYFRDAKPDGSPPNNWVSLFGGSSWAWDEATAQYYLHTFLPEQPDLNWRNPEVVNAMHDVLRFWMRRGVDGFRIDVAHALGKHPELRDNPLGTERSHKPRGDTDLQRHVHDLGHPDVHAIFRRLRRVVDDFEPGRERVAIGEIHDYDVAHWAQYYGRPTEAGGLDGLHMPFNFGLLNVPFEAAPIRSLVEALEAHVPAGGWPNYVLGNHDESRLATRVGPERARLAAMLLLTLRGTPTLYYGDELGMRDVPVPLDQQRDPWGKRVPGLDLSRDPCRTPMRWDASPGAGFTAGPPEQTWLPLGDDIEAVNVAHQRDDPASMLSLYRKLLDVRKSEPALRIGSLEWLDVGDDLLAYRRQHHSRSVMVIMNFSAEPRTVAFAPDVSVVATTSPSAGRRAAPLNLEPWEGRVVRPSSPADTGRRPPDALDTPDPPP